MSELKEKYIQFCCDFYNEHAPEDKLWFGRMYDECLQEHNKRNSTMYRWQFPLMILKSQQAEIDQLKAKNTQLTHALVNANAEKSKWQKDYWGQVERSAEYGAMLMTDPDSLEFKCYQKEKQNEELVKQLKIQQVILSALKPRLHKTDMGGCLHFSTTMFHEGKAECFACGAVVNHERKVIGVMKRQ